MQLTLPLDLPSKLPQLREILLRVYGLQRDPLRHDPNEQLVKAMLSSQTRDQISEAVFQRLMRTYPSLDALADAPLAELVRIIGPVTHAENKALYLRETLRFLRVRYGRIDLWRLQDLSMEDARYLLQLWRGIGPKVAATILNFSSLRKRVFAIDTHVRRVFGRVGVLPAHATFDFAHKAIMRVIPDDWDADDLYELHWLIKMHGQETCRHERPACATCSLARICTTAGESTQAHAA